MFVKKLIAAVSGTLLLALGMPLAAYAASTVVVTPTATQGWTSTAPGADTRPGGAVNFITDTTSPAPNGALQLTTSATTTAKAQYMHAASVPLSSVTQLSYYTKQVSPLGTVADPSYQLPVCLTGAGTTSCNPGLTGTPGSSSFSTLVFEPYQNPGNNGNAAVVNNVWQKWDVAAGLFWSTRTVVCSNGTIVGSAGGPSTYTLAQIQTACPQAFVLGYGVNIGTNNPGYNVETDLFNFNGTVYDFQVVNMPTSEKQCRQNGYLNYTDAQGKPFKNAETCRHAAQERNHAMREHEGEGGGDHTNAKPSEDSSHRED